MPRVKLCAECGHPKSHHRTASCSHTWRAMGATFMGNRIITHWCLEYLSELRGHDLVCWCPPGQACHATALLELANQGGEQL